VAQSGREFSTCGSDTKQFVSLSAVGTTAVQYPMRRVWVQAGGKKTPNNSMNQADKQKFILN